VVLVGEKLTGLPVDPVLTHELPSKNSHSILPQPVPPDATAESDALPPVHIVEAPEAETVGSATIVTVTADDVAGLGLHPVPEQT